MSNKKLWLGIIVIILVFGMSATGCKRNVSFVKSKNMNYSESKNMFFTESEHFRIYYTIESKSTLEKILNILEENYERITSILMVKLSEKCDIYIYPDLQSFHKAINWPDAQDWLVGVFQDNAIRIVSPNNPGPQHNSNSIMKVVVHEFVHLTANEINSNAPIYLAEGLALFLAEQHYDNKYFVSSSILNNTFPSIETLNTLTGDNGLYQFSGAFVEYIVHEYGYDGLINFYKNPNIQEVFQIDNNSFNKNWLEYVTKTYLP